MTVELAEDAMQKKAVLYDKGGDKHYDYISAWIKSTRGSDVDASLYYLAVMLEGGEDPRFIARRMIVLASEDIGNADPQALVVAVAAAQAVEHVGMPECALNLSQAAAYLALAPKSNASTQGDRTGPRRRAARGRRRSALLPSGRALSRRQEAGARRGLRVPAQRCPTACRTSRCCPRGMEDRRYYEPTDRGFEEQAARADRRMCAKSSAKTAISHYALIQPMGSIRSKQGSATLSSARRTLRLGFAALAAMVVVSLGATPAVAAPATSTWAAMASCPTKLPRVR